jgi:hypothetical protein
MHLAILPQTLIYGVVDEPHLTTAVHLAVFPFAVVCGLVGEAHLTKTIPGV